jgi:hypothetical protein
VCGGNNSFPSFFKIFFHMSREDKGGILCIHQYLTKNFLSPSLPSLSLSLSLQPTHTLQLSILLHFPPLDQHNWLRFFFRDGQIGIFMQYLSFILYPGRACLASAETKETSSLKFINLVNSNWQRDILCRNIPGLPAHWRLQSAWLLQACYWGGSLVPTI